MNRLPKSSSEVASFSECRKALDWALKDLAACKTMRQASGHAARGYQKDARDAKTENKSLRRGMVRITKTQKAKDELKATGAWSGAAIGSVTLLWQGFDQYGTPFPKFLMDSDFFYGGVCWVVTLLFGWAAKAYHHVDHQ
jgi:hypothetical protein